jgi:hypothetical protein
MKIINLLFIIIFVCTVLFFVFYKKLKYENYNKDVLNYRSNISMNYFGKVFEKCKAISNDYSHGLLIDALIICKYTEHLEDTPFFYFEYLPSDFYKDSWYFVNLDYTDFSTISDSPNTIVCKTRQTYDILYKKFPNKNVIYTGFTSIDKYIPEINRNYRKFIHIAGKSPWKGTDSIINAWKNHPEWTELLVIYNDKNKQIKGANNIKIISKHLPDKELNKLMNEYGIHICASEHEGFGHYINEARSVKAVVLFTDAPPMNEFFNNNSGIPIKAYYSGIYNNICPSYKTTTKDIENAVSKVLSMKESELVKMGEQARINFLENDFNFKKLLEKNIRKEY